MSGCVGQGFRFGIATAGFQVEGGFNGPGEPRNNWYGWEAAGRIEPSGSALDFWNDYERHLDRAGAIGVDSFRLSVEWARCEPEEGRVDDESFARYATILEACRERGMQPLVTLHHFTHPEWLGEEFWTRRDAPERFAVWAALAADRLGELCDSWVTINEINVLALLSFVLGAFPPGHRLDGTGALRVADHLLAAHVLAYGELKERLPEASVSTNNCCFSVYELDRMLVDLLLLRSRGIARDEAAAHLAERRARWYATPAGRGVRRADGTLTRWRPRLEEALRRLAAQVVDPVAAFGRTLEAVYRSRHDRCLDSVQLDFYDPESASHFQLPYRATAGGRWRTAHRPLWDDPPNPQAFAAYLEASVEAGLDVLVVENGLCNRVRRGRTYPRVDGWTRPRYVAENLAALVGAVERGVPVGGYWHWCLADNYEWGTYEPRFGLYGVDRERGVGWSDRDSLGDDSAGTYRRLIQAVRAGDKEALAAAVPPPAHGS